MPETEKVKAYQRTTSTGQVVTVKAHERMNTEAAVDAQNHEDRPPIAARGGTFPGNRSLPGIWLAPPPVPTLSPDAKAAHAASQKTPDASTPNTEIASNGSTGNEADGHHVHLHVDTKTGKVVTAAQRYLADVVALARPVHVDGYRRRNNVTGKVSTVHPYVQGRAVAALQDLLDRPHVQARSGSFGQTGAEPAKAAPEHTNASGYPRDLAGASHYLGALPVGSEIKVGSGMTFTKTDADTWTRDGKTWGNEDLAHTIWAAGGSSTAKVTKVGGSAPVVKPKPTRKTRNTTTPKTNADGFPMTIPGAKKYLDDLPVGSQVVLYVDPAPGTSSYKPLVYTKARSGSDQDWFYQSPVLGRDWASSASMAKDAKSVGFEGSSLVKMGDGKPVAGTVGTNAHGVPKDKAALTKFLRSQPDGTTVQWGADDVAVYHRTSGEWVTQGTTGSSSDVANLLAGAPDDEAWDSISVVHPDQDTSKHVKYTGTPHAPRTYGSTIPDSKFEPPLLASGKPSHAAKPKAELAESEKSLNLAANYVPQAVADQLTAVKIRSHDADDAAIAENPNANAILAFVDHQPGSLPNMHLPQAMFRPDLEKQKASEQPTFDWNTGEYMNWWTPTDVPVFDRVTGHESGHAWEAIAQELGDRQQIEKFYSDLTDIVMDQLNIDPFPSTKDPFNRWQQTFNYDGDHIGGAASAYARSNVNEFLAENWAEYINSKNPRPLAMKVGSRFQDLLDEVAKTITTAHPTPHGKDLYA